MELEIKSSFNKDILEVSISGEGSEKASQVILTKMIQLVEQTKPKRILIDLQCIQGRLDILGTYNLVRNYPLGMPHIKTAIIDKEENKYFSSFHETASINAGFVIQYFTNIELAYRWLKT